VQQTLRPFATAGVALVGASLIAIAPMAAPGPDIQMLDVALTSGDTDLLTPWEDVFNTASANATTLTNNFSSAPFVDLQQLIANDSGYLQDFFNAPTSSTVSEISGQMQANLAAVLTGLPLQDATSETTKTVTQFTLQGSGLEGHAVLFSEIASFLPASEAGTLTPIIDFLGSPDSGIIMGDLGPLISPLIALSDSISAGDDLNETLANTVGAFFNGADLNLDSLIPAAEASGYLPAGMNIENLDIAFGGLLSTGGVGADSDGVGGSIFNSLGIDLTGVPVLGTIDAPSEAVGPIGAWEGMSQAIASLLGWDGSGSPLTDVTFPVIPTDFLDGSTIPAAAAADLSSLVQDVVSALGL